MARDLENIVVVAVEQAVAAPYATGKLADAGARVIKVERPEGDFARQYDRFVQGQSAYFVWLNRGKESICLDIKAEADRALLHRMIGTADIFVQNLRPNLLAEMGLGADALRARHPRLITCDITGFGEGPRSHLKAYDLIVQGEAGLCSITGNKEGPARVGVSVCDIAAGMTAHAALLQALFVRERTGEGRAISVSLFDSVADWMNVPLLQYLYGGHHTERAGVAHPSIAPYGAFACGDGTKIIFSVQNDREWVRFCQTVLERPELTRTPDFHDNSARVLHRDALSAILCGIFAPMTEGDLCRRLDLAEIAYGRLNSIETAAEHPHLRFVTVDTPGGEVRVIAPAARVEGIAFDPGPVPALGAQSAAIRAEYVGEASDRRGG